MLWCHSHLVWLVYWGFHAYMCLFSWRKTFLWLCMYCITGISQWVSEIEIVGLVVNQISLLYNIFLGAVVPTVNTITSDTGPFIAGQSYNLTCTVTLKNTTRPPTVEWLDPNNNPLHSRSEITVGDTVAVNCSTYITTLHFTRLRISHSGQYSCQATLGAVNNTASINITVKSKNLPSFMS